jgi:hypothetical protein
VISKLATSLRDDARRDEAAMTPLERLRLAQRLGDEAVARYARAHGVSEAEAAREFARRRQAGRRPSRCAAIE